MPQKQPDFDTRRVVTAVVSQYEFSDDQARRDFEKVIGRQVQWNGDRFESENGVEVDAFIRQEYERRPGVKPNRPMTSSSSGSSADASVIVTDVDIHSIGPHSTPAEIEAYRKALVSVLPQSKGRR
jgi:hypothetical protein